MHVLLPIKKVKKSLFIISIVVNMTIRNILIICRYVKIYTDMNNV